MRYNNYRQYVNLNGVKRENKFKVIENLKPFKKNVMSMITKEQYDKLKSKYQHLRFEININSDNSIKSIELQAYKLVTDRQPSLKVNIPIPKLCYFNGLDDGDDERDSMIFKYYDTANNEKKFDLLGLEFEGHHYNQTQLSTDYLSSIWQDETWFHQQAIQEFNGQVINWITAIPIPNFDHVIIWYNLDNYDQYNEIPPFIITYFE